MQSQDKEVLQQALAWIQSGAECWLCTVVATVGSSPRPVGSMLACNAAGESTGSLSGGCVEEDLLLRLSSGDIDTTTPQRLEYGVSAAENERLGLPCGGRLQVMVQPLAARDEPWLQGAIAAIDDRRCVKRSLALATGLTELLAAEQFADLLISDDLLQQSLGPQMRMLLVGAGQLAQSLAELALAMDYEVIVTDPRQQAISQWRGPDVSLLQGMPDDVILQHANDRFAIVITLTHDPRIDDMALMEALATDAWYVGALGSQRTTAKRLQRLRELGLSEEELARLHAPVGLPIGSKTPLEIAVAIMAQITRLRRLG